MRLNLLAFIRPLGLIGLALALSAPAAAAERAPSPQAPVAKASAGPDAPSPAIYLLSDSDTKIYLFGTVHVLPPGFKWRSPAIDRIIAEADELIVETYEAPGQGDYSDAHRRMQLDKPSPILFRVAPEHRKPLKAAIQASGIPIKYLDGMHTWAAAMTLGMSQLLGSYGADDAADAPGVEDVLERVFRESGKPIGSVENPGLVVDSLNAIPAEEQANLLIETISEGTPEELTQSDDEDRMWARGELDAMARSAFDDFPPALYEALLTRRNRAWTGWLEQRLEKPGTILFAVGAGHLGGPDSVRTMLARRGLQVTRVDR
ncbi:MAG TPA: TraB/GumN family protein [Allosphingosinicella sp.]